MASHHRRSSPSSYSASKIKISKQMVESMIEAEVQKAMKKEESQLDALIQSVQQQLDQSTSVNMLQARILAATEKAEKALAYLNETSTSLEQSGAPSSLSPTLEAPTPPLADSHVVDTHLRVQNVRSLSKISVIIEGSTVQEFMENTKKEFERLHAENAALRAAFESLREQTSPRKTRKQSGVINGLAKLMHVKTEPVDLPEDTHSTSMVTQKGTNDKIQSSKAGHVTKKIKSEPEEVNIYTPHELPYPALPQLPVPARIPPEAKQYCLPPRLKVDLALIKNPSPQLSVVWTSESNYHNAPPMGSYSVFFTTERALGCGFFEDWQNLGEHPAAPLPMFSLIPQYRPGHKICVTVVGKDMFDRYGPYSKVSCAYI